MTENIDGMFRSKEERDSDNERKKEIASRAEKVMRGIDKDIEAKATKDGNEEKFGSLAFSFSHTKLTLGEPIELSELREKHPNLAEMLTTPRGFLDKSIAEGAVLAGISTFNSLERNIMSIELKAPSGLAEVVSFSASPLEEGGVFERSHESGVDRASTRWYSFKEPVETYEKFSLAIEEASDLAAEAISDGTSVAEVIHYVEESNNK